MSKAGIRPQIGPQEQFLASPADIAIYGGAAFGGKTFALLMEAARFTGRQDYSAVIFRRTSPQITNAGGLWDTSSQIYSQLGATGLVGKLQWTFPSGARINFAHLQHEKDKFSWQGAQVPFIGLDEVTHFSEGQFWYLVSRNRDPSGGVAPYIRATCNPDPDSFIAGMVDWWIDQETGFAIPERSGAIRYFVRYHDELVFADSAEALVSRYPGSLPKSLTFIASSYHDNPMGMAADPGYLANLEALPRVERERLKNGNWKIRPAAGDYFRASDFLIVDPEQVPNHCRWVRYWDRAATEPSAENPDPDWTAGVLMGRDQAGDFYISHVERFRCRPGEVFRRILSTAEQDGRRCTVGIELDPGQAGKFEGETYIKALAGFNVRLQPPWGDKATRAAPVSSQASAGNIRLVRGAWLDAYLAELENFPVGGHDDQVDATSGAFSILSAGGGRIEWTPVSQNLSYNSSERINSPVRAIAATEIPSTERGL